MEAKSERASSASKGSSPVTLTASREWFEKTLARSVLESAYGVYV